MSDAVTSAVTSGVHSDAGSNKPIVVLIGLPASGKTRLGRRVAKILERDFLDTDHLIREEHGPIPQIFRDHSEAYFREIERLSVVRALASAGVVSLGGGAVLNKETALDLRSHRVIHVTVSEESVQNRIHNSDRPLLADGLNDWLRLRDERFPIYESLASWSIDTSSEPFDFLAQNVVDWVEGKL